MYKTVDPALSKQTAFEIAWYAYRGAIIKNFSNEFKGLRGTGLYALTLIQLHKRIDEYQSGGIYGDFKTASWLVRRPYVVASAQNANLTLPPEPARKKKKRRKTIDTAGRLVIRLMIVETSGHQSCTKPVTSKKA